MWIKISATYVGFPADPIHLTSDPVKINALLFQYCRYIHKLLESWKSFCFKSTMWQKVPRVRHCYKNVLLLRQLRIILGFIGSFCQQISGTVTSRDTKSFSTSCSEHIAPTQAVGPQKLQISLPDLQRSLLWGRQAGRQDSEHVITNTSLVATF